MEAEDGEGDGDEDISETELCVLGVDVRVFGDMSIEGVLGNDVVAVPFSRSIIACKSEEVKGQEVRNECGILRSEVSAS